MRIAARRSVTVDNQSWPSYVSIVLEQIRRHLSAKPFEPFIIMMADGRMLDVKAPDGLWISPKGGLFYWHQEDDTIERVNLILVTGVRGALSSVDH